MEVTDRCSLGAPHHNIILTPDEKRVFGQLFTAATVDTENRSVVTGEVAVKFFEKSGLNPRIVGEVTSPPSLQRRMPTTAALPRLTRNRFGVLPIPTTRATSTILDSALL